MHLSKKEDYCLTVSSDMHPEQDLFETIDVIPAGKTLHLTSLQVMCDPMRDSTGVSTRLRVDILWRKQVEGEEVSHPIDLVYTECGFFKVYPDKLDQTLDGTLLHGDGKAALIIRRQVKGKAGPQHTFVVLKGHIQ